MSEWSQEEIKFLNDNGNLLEEGEYSEFYERALNVLGEYPAKHLLLGAALVCKNELKVFLSLKPTSSKMAYYSFGVYLPDIGEDILYSIGHCNNDSDNHTALKYCRINLLQCGATDSLIEKIFKITMRLGVTK